MRVLVIGATGFIGPSVVAALERDGHDVVIFHRGSGPRAAANEILGDRRRLAEHRTALRALRPDVVVDLVLSSGRQAAELVDVFRGAAGRLVAISSGDVYRACGVLHGSEPGPLQPVPLTEDSDLRTSLQTYPPERIAMLQQVFGCLDDEYDKIPVEREIQRDRDLPATVLRLPMVYGPGDRLRRFLPIVKRILDGRTTILIEETFSAWRAPRGYVENVAAAIALAATSDRAAGRVYNVGELDSVSEFEWSQRIADAMAWRGRFIVLPRNRMPAHLVTPGNFEQDWATSTARIREELGYMEPIAQHDAICRTIEWERANPTESSPHAFDYAAEDAAVVTST